MKTLLAMLAIGFILYCSLSFIFSHLLGVSIAVVFYLLISKE